jgi:PAS domain-containing protein
MHHSVVDTDKALTDELETSEWDVITSDNAMPQFSAQAVLEIVRQLCPEVPVIIVSADVNFNIAITLMKQGASDYIQKGQLARLGPAIDRVLRESSLQREHDFDQNALQVSELRYRRLFETAQDGILILDAHAGEIMDINPFLIEMLGYLKNEVLGKKLWDIVRSKTLARRSFPLRSCRPRAMCAIAICRWKPKTVARSRWNLSATFIWLIIARWRSAISVTSANASMPTMRCAG